MHSPSDNLVNSTTGFLRTVENVDWFGSAGMPADAYRTVPGIAEGFDSDKSVWLRHTQALEQAALPQVGDAGVDFVFRKVADTLHQGLYDGAVRYFDRRRTVDPSYDPAGVDGGLLEEMMDCVKRDLAWAAVEEALERRDFFTVLLAHYRAGRWPCSWIGEYPQGSVLVL